MRFITLISIICSSYMLSRLHAFRIKEFLPSPPSSLLSAFHYNSNLPSFSSKFEDFGHDKSKRLQNGSGSKSTPNQSPSSLSSSTTSKNYIPTRYSDYKPSRKFLNKDNKFTPLTSSPFDYNYDHSSGHNGVAQIKSMICGRWHLEEIIMDRSSWGTCLNKNKAFMRPKTSGNPNSSDKTKFTEQNYKRKYDETFIANNQKSKAIINNFSKLRADYDFNRNEDLYNSLACHELELELRNSMEKTAIKLTSSGQVIGDVESNRQGLGWKLNQKDVFSQSMIEFRIVLPPPKNKVDYYDGIPSTYYYNGIFSNDLMHVRGDIERYAMIDDDEFGCVRRRIKIGQFYLYKDLEYHEE